MATDPAGARGRCLSPSSAQSDRYGLAVEGGARDEASVELDRVRMAFGEREVFRSLTCRFPRAKISVVLGGSGSGKSTILRLIGGLVRPQAGRIRVDGDDLTGLSESALYAVRRKLGMMFQGGALL